MPPPTECPICRSTDLHDDVRPIGPHYGKRVCPNGHHCGWLPHPRTAATDPPAELADLVVRRGIPVALKGTSAQIGLARSIRARLDSRNTRTGRHEFVAMVRCVQDATWFLANRHADGPVDLKCWPRVDQMAPVGETADQ